MPKVNKKFSVSFTVLIPVDDAEKIIKHCERLKVTRNTLLREMVHSELKRMEENGGKTNANTD